MHIVNELEIPYIPSLQGFDPDQILAGLHDFGAKASIECVNWREQYPYQPLTVVNVAHNGKLIYIDFFVRCNYLCAVNYINNSPVASDSCIEFFVSPTCDNHYWNFEFNCIGTINASHRSERKNPTRLTDDQLARVLRYASCGNRPFQEIEGLFTWNVLIGIPLDLIGVEYKGEPVEMRGNFYKCASGTSQPHFVSLFPIDTPNPDFHRPEFFGKIILK